MSSTEIDYSAVRSLVGRAVRAAVPGSDGYSVQNPRAGFDAAMAVGKLVDQELHRFARELRGEGSTWLEIAGLMQLPWSDDYSRPERAYELVRGPDHEGRVYWRCAGCSAYVTDHGPYDGYPEDTESGHTTDCTRHRADVLRWNREQEEREERDQAADAALKKITDSFGRETVGRARWVLAHGGQYMGWSTSESLAVALVLRDDAQLRAQGYSTRKAAIERVVSGMGTPISNPTRWLATVRTAATGLNT